MTTKEKNYLQPHTSDRKICNQQIDRDILKEIKSSTIIIDPPLYWAVTYDEISGDTRTTQLCFLLPFVATIVVVPSAFAVTTPVVETSAIDWFSLFQVVLDELPDLVLS